MNKDTGKHRSGGRAARRAARAAEPAAARRPVWPGVTGGQYRPLGGRDMERIHEAALTVLETVGFKDAIPSCVERVTSAGGRLDGEGRLLFPRALVEDMIPKARRNFVLRGIDPDRAIEISPRRVHFGTAGAPVTIQDFETGEYRPTRITDLYDAMRLVDTLEHVHYAGRAMAVAEFSDPGVMDLNCAYAILGGTTKPAGQGITRPDTLGRIIAMCDLILGGEGRFRTNPIYHAFNCFVVPPLTFAAESCAVLEATVLAGMPVILLSAGQAGATAPAALAGALVQSIAEVLAGVVYVNLIAPGHPTLFGPWPFVSDLRSGAMSGGSGEQAVLMAAAGQMAEFYGLPFSIAAGMSDSKLPDAQAGFEKGYSTVLAAASGANLVHEAAGSQASLLGISLEGFVIDNEMLGAVLRTVRGMEVNDDTLSVRTIAETARGPGHYLGHAQTIGRMETDFLYPHLADRQPPDQWQAAGSTDMRTRAQAAVRDTLGRHYPDHIGSAVDARIRERFDIRLSRDAMKPGNGRW